MTRLINTLAAAAVGTLLATGAFAESANQTGGASPYIAIMDEAAPRLIVDPPIAEALAHGVVQIQYHAENVHIVPVFGAGALNVSPRVGHLHVTVDDLPWHWADASNGNTIDLVGLPPGQHKVLIELANAAHQVFPGQAVTVSFTIPNTVVAHTH